MLFCVKCDYLCVPVSLLQLHAADAKALGEVSPYPAFSVLLTSFVAVAAVFMFVCTACLQLRDVAGEADAVKQKLQEEIATLTAQLVTSQATSKQRISQLEAQLKDGEAALNDLNKQNSLLYSQVCAHRVAVCLFMPVLVFVHASLRVCFCKPHHPLNLALCPSLWYGIWLSAFDALTSVSPVRSMHWVNVWRGR